jgi:hypothetical protein
MEAWLKEKFARQYAFHLLTRGPITLNISACEKDGRKRGAVLRMLIGEGWVTKNAAGETFDITSLAYDQLVAVKPTFAVNKSNDRAPGVLFLARWGEGNSDLSVANIKYIFEHAKDYTLFAFHTFKREVIGEVFSPADADRIRDTLYSEPSSSLVLLISDEEHTAAHDKLLFDQQLARVMANNLANGLLEYKLIDGADKDAFSSRNKDNFFLGAETNVFGQDPAKWQQEAEEILAACREKIAANTRKANAIVAMQARLAEFGGWDKFLTEYEALCMAAVKKADEPVDKKCVQCRAPEHASCSNTTGCPCCAESSHV